MLQPAQMVPTSDIYNDSNATVCRDCLDPVGACTCNWQIMQLDASYSIYTTLNDDMTKQPSSSPSSFFSDLLKLDGLNCGGIPTRTTPTLTPTTLRTIAADIASLSSVPPGDFAAAASDLHHLVSTSCSNINTSNLGATDRLSTDLQECVSIQNLGHPQIEISLQNLNNQHTSLNNLQNHQNINQNTLNQQQRNDYTNSFQTAASRQAGFVPPLVLQINSSNPSAQQSSGTTVLSNNNSSGSSSIFSTKGSSTSASSSHWHGAVVTQTPQHQGRSTTRPQFTDDEDGDEDYDSAADDGTDSSDTTSGKMTRKSNTKNNKSSSKTSIKNEFKNNSGGGRRTNNKDNKIMSAEEEQRRQIRRERNKLAAARCRKRRMDHTNELLEETEQLEDKKLRLQVEIQGLHKQKTDLQQMLAQHKCTVNMKNVQLSNSVTTVLDSNEISETKPIILSNHLLSIKGNTLQQQNISTNVVSSDNDSNNIGDIIIKHEDLQTDIDTKDNINIIPTSVMQLPQRRRPTTLLQLNNDNFGNSKNISENGSTGVVVLNFDSLMDGGTGLTPVSTSAGSVQSHNQQVQHRSTGNGSINTDNNSVLS